MDILLLFYSLEQWLFQGFGKALCTVAVRETSFYGRSMMALRVEPEPTPLQQNLKSSLPKLVRLVLLALLSH